MKRGSLAFPMASKSPRRERCSCAHIQIGREERNEVRNSARVGEAEWVKESVSEWERERGDVVERKKVAEHKTRVEIVRTKRSNYSTTENRGDTTEEAEKRSSKKFILSYFLSHHRQRRRRRRRQRRRQFHAGEKPACPQIKTNQKSQPSEKNTKRASFQDNKFANNPTTTSPPPPVPLLSSKQELSKPFIIFHLE